MNRNKGFNSGVTLYNLAKIRQSDDYKDEISLYKMADGFDMFEFNGSVGDQDWLTILGWLKPNLFYILPCQYNMQMLALSQCTSFSSQELCDAYAKCDTTHVPAKILHKTGTIH